MAETGAHSARELGTNNTAALIDAARARLDQARSKLGDDHPEVQKLKSDGVRLISEEIKAGAGGHRYVFVHPSSAGGVLLELVESGH